MTTQIVETNVKNLKINKLTQAQYNAAVQSGVIGDNELSIITDAMDGPVEVMPTASLEYLNAIVQFAGVTDANYTNGYFYKCVSDGASTPTYSWENIEVQPAGSSLPDQTGNAGKFLTTDGTDASWSDKPLVNTATGTDSLTVLGTPTNKNYSINIGAYSSCNYNDTVAVGYRASAKKQYAVAIGRYCIAKEQQSVAIGNSCNAERPYSLAIGQVCYAQADGAIQIGCPAGANAPQNTDANTFKVGNQNGNFEIMSADGTIPEARLADMTNALQGQVLTLDSNNNAVWATPSSGGGVPTLTWYTISTAGTTLTIADTSSAQLVKIYKNGLLLQPTEDYTISGTTLTTVSAMVVGDKITTEVF